MTPKTKKPIDFKFIITNISIIGLGVSIMWMGMKYAAESKTKMFETPQQREKTRQHIDSDYNEVKNYKLMEEQKEMKIYLDTAYAFVNAIFKEDRAAKKIDSFNNTDAIKSRARRDSLREDDARRIGKMEINQQNMNNALLSIQRILLDTIN